IARIRAEGRIQELHRGREIGSATSDAQRRAMEAEQHKLDQRKEIDIAIQNASAEVSAVWERIKADLFQVANPFVKALNDLMRVGRGEAGAWGPTELADRIADMDRNWRLQQNPKWEAPRVPAPFQPNPAPNPLGGWWRGLLGPFGLFGK